MELRRAVERRTSVRVAFIAVAAVVTVACSDGNATPSNSNDSTQVIDQPARPGMSDANYDPFVPFETLQDWVSYSDAVVVLTVTDEIPPDPDDEPGRMGWPPGQSIRIEETMWQHTDAPTPPVEIDFQGGMLFLEPSKAPSISFRLASVGDQYLVGLARYDPQGWMTTTPALKVAG